METSRPRRLLGLILAEKKDFKHAVEALNLYVSAAPDAADAAIVRKQRIEIETRAQSR